MIVGVEHFVYNGRLFAILRGYRNLDAQRIRTGVEARLNALASGAFWLGFSVVNTTAIIAFVLNAFGYLTQSRPIS